MYIVAIAWLFVALVLTISQPNLVAAVLTFVFWGLVPLALLLWLVGTPARLRAKARRQHASPIRKDAPDSSDNAGRE